MKSFLIKKNTFKNGTETNMNFKSKSLIKIQKKTSTKLEMFFDLILIVKFQIQSTVFGRKMLLMRK